jgi:hypothetical protein
MSDQEFYPLEGEPTLLQAKAEHYGEIANAIIRSVSTLKRIKDSSDMTSKAISAVREKSGDVAEDIDKARDRYAGTAAALVTYSHKLKAAQDAANTAIAHIKDREDSLRTAQHTAAKAKSAADTAADADKATADKAAHDADHTATTAGTQLDAAQDEWRSALHDKNTAADAAIKAIVEVVDGKKSHDLNDGWWDNWGSKLLSVLKVICDVAGILSIFLAWVPILGQVLLILAAVGAVIELIESVVKAVNGDGSWGDVIWAAGGAVLSIFGGKLIALAGKSFKAMTLVRVAEHTVDGATPGAMAAVQGVGRHSAEFMNFGEASRAAKPFSELVPQAFGASFEGGGPMAAFLKESLKENFIPHLVSKDLMFSIKTAIQHPGILTDIPYVVHGATLTAMTVGQDAVHFHEAFEGFDIHHTSPGDIAVRSADFSLEGVHKVVHLVHDVHEAQEGFSR